MRNAVCASEVARQLMRAGFAVLCGTSGLFVAGQATAQTAAGDIATAVRSEGHQCESPKDAVRDESLSKPDQAVWVIECESGRYRVTFPGDEAPIVEAL